MLNKITRFLIAHKIIALLIALSIIGIGYITFPFETEDIGISRNPIPVDAIPDIGENQQIVFTQWKGQSPQEIQSQITYPLTTALMGIPGVKTIRSSSMFGFSSIYIIFEESIDFYWSRTRILEKLNALPKGLLPEGIQPSLGPDATGIGQIFWYTLEGRDEAGKPTGGWRLDEIRSVQDYYVKYALSGTKGISEVASIGGMVRTYKVAVNPDKLKIYKIPLQKVIDAVAMSNKDVGAKTMEINQVEYIIRGLGYIKKIEDIENTVVKSSSNAPILIKDIAHVYLGPQERRGILDKEGAEVVGGVAIARYGSNPMAATKALKEKIKEISTGLPKKTLANGKTSQLTIVPFYDRSKLIGETINTLSDALLLELLITILVIVIMVYDLRAATLISTLLPLAILMVFMGMKYFDITANIVALSGIAIAIGTIVDVGIILSENILKKLKSKPNLPINKAVYKATKEVSSAIITAVMTTIVSFIPVFTMTGAEGKLFGPLAATKTMALVAAIVITLVILPAFASWIFKFQKQENRQKMRWQYALLLLGAALLYFNILAGLTVLIYVIASLLVLKATIGERLGKTIQIGLVALCVLMLLSKHWMPLGLHFNGFSNFLFVSLICGSVLGTFYLFRQYYQRILAWTLARKWLFLCVPILIVVWGGYIYKHTGKEFMPTLEEGSFLLMPTSLPHAGVTENRDVLQMLDKTVMTIPEIKSVLGKAGRVESAIDPAPLSMYENIIEYYPEYKSDKDGNIVKFKTDKAGLFLTKAGDKIPSGTRIDINDLIRDETGDYFRNWRDHINNIDDIWNEIVTVSKIPGVTSAPKLRPIQTRIIMLQTGMRSPMGIKIKGSSLKEIEAFGRSLEPLLKEVAGVNPQTVFADRIIGKPYLSIVINREKLGRYGLHIMQVQQAINAAVGGKIATQTIEGRERYNVEVRYPRELRTQPEDLKNIDITTPDGSVIPLTKVIDIKYEKGPQVIKSEDTFLVGYVLFDKMDNEAEVDIVERAKRKIETAIEKGDITIPSGISYSFTGTYENQVRATKKLMIIIPTVLLIILLILYLQFKSMGTTLMIFSGIAVAFSGGFIMIWLYNQPWFLNFSLWGIDFRELFQIHTIYLSVAVWVGFIALFGIATDDGVLMATYLCNAFDKKPMKSIEDIRAAVIKAGTKRLRPCLMTTATTLLALLPILTTSEKGSSIMIPMAIPCFGGMTVALITLFIVPVLFSMKKEWDFKRMYKKNML